VTPKGKLIVQVAKLDEDVHTSDWGSKWDDFFLFVFGCRRVRAGDILCKNHFSSSSTLIYLNWGTYDRDEF